MSLVDREVVPDPKSSFSTSNVSSPAEREVPGNTSPDYSAADYYHIICFA